MNLDAAPMDKPRLLSLAPTDPVSLTDTRYQGDTLTVTVAALPEDQRDTVRRLYDFLVEVLTVSEAHLHAAVRGLERLKGMTRSSVFDDLVDRIRGLGAGLHADEVPDEVKQSIHDIRGGSLMALLMHLDMIGEDAARPADLQRIFILARDHLKMMRNAVKDLDVARYEADLNEQDHAIDLLEEKWRNVRYAGGATIRFHSDFHGVVSQRCMEFSALDRVIYNLVNNAAAHAADGEVHVAITAVDDHQETHLRFAVMNRVSKEQTERLYGELGDDLGVLFRGGFTTGGHGIGLRIVGDFVSQGYGRKSLDAALDDQLLGIDVVDDLFVAWFHWPGIRREASSQAAK